ncbi:MAG: hypothetical protein WCJ14_00175 [Verrucomicrobiota bacterium]
MHLTSFLADQCGAAALDWMLRAFGVAAIVWAFFKGLKSLVAKPAAALAPQPAALAPQPAAVLPQPAAPAATVAKAPAPAQPEGLTPEIIAIIAAAVTSVLGSAHRIVSIKSQNSHWEKAGRQSVLTSHRIR